MRVFAVYPNEQTEGLLLTKQIQITNKSSEEHNDLKLRDPQLNLKDHFHKSEQKTLFFWLQLNIIEHPTETQTVAKGDFAS